MKSPFKIPTRFFAVGLLVALASCAGQISPADARRELAGRNDVKQVTSILFVGNSYSFGVSGVLRAYARNRGNKVRVEQITTGGWTLAQHAASEKSLEKIREGQWDFVVIQEHSRIPSLPPARRAKLMGPPLHQLVDEIRKQGAIPVLYQTWGYRDGDQKRPKDDFHAMSRRLREGYQAAGNAENISIVPVGVAWEKEVSAGNSVKLFQQDGSHPTDYGNQVTARVFFETFFPK